MENTMWKNEKRIFENISKEIKEKASPESKDRPFSTPSGSNRHISSKNTSMSPDKGNPDIMLSESSTLDILTKIISIDGNPYGGRVSIEHDKQTNSYKYYFENTLLADVYTDKEYFPTESSSNTNKNTTVTVRENLQRILENNPDSRIQKHCDIILNSFDEVLSIDPEQEIEPMSDSELKIKGLERKNNELSKENHELKREDKSKSAKIEDLESTVEELKSTIATLESEKSDSKKTIAKLQSMLEKALNFVEKIKAKPILSKFASKELDEVKDLSQNVDEDGR